MVQWQTIIAEVQVLALAMGSLDEIKERGRLISHGFLHPNPKPIYLEHSLFKLLLIVAIIWWSNWPLILWGCDAEKASAMVPWMWLKREKGGFKQRSAVDWPSVWATDRCLMPPLSRNLGSSSLFSVWAVAMVYVFESMGFWNLRCSCVGFL